MSPRVGVLGLCGAVVLGLAACASTSQRPAEPAGPAPGTSAAPGQVNPHARAMADFQERIKEYMALQAKIQRELPTLGGDATPEQIYKHQLALAARIRSARQDARPGHLFSPDLRVVIRTLMAQVFGGPDGAQLKAAIMDENPGRIKVAINDRYPDTVPLSTVPPQVIAGLPPLPPKALEYRFLGRALIILDIEAHLIVDLMENAIP